MDRQMRRELMKKVSYGYFKLPHKEKGHGVLTIAVAQNGERAYYGASICAPGDMFCRTHGKFGTGERYLDRDGKFVRVPGAQGRLVNHLRGETGLLQGSCKVGDTTFESTQNALEAMLADLRNSGSRKLKWLRDVDFDAVEPMTKRKKEA